MKLFKISQSINNDYDTYDSAVVAAPNETIAKTIHPGSDKYVEEGTGFDPYGTWCRQNDVKVEEIGKSKNPDFVGVICASFNAG